MGWDGIHLFQFSLRAARYGSRELSASSPDVTLAALRLRKGARFVYEYDLNIPWKSSGPSSPTLPRPHFVAVSARHCGRVAEIAERGGLQLLTDEQLRRRKKAEKAAVRELHRLLHPS
ncbi:MAG TPA: hypothetical protein VKI00_24655 [Mycobacterium sp.]|uniref:hypothetical protein n=1 Tax=Mycobacterium sp. TaxID=1785 RepID=UPI002D076431|nr:hypothetical protein [Mycobacterium sp.]HME78726.1 hypothetical protein [Mycobacterium sp.]